MVKLRKKFKRKKKIKYERKSKYEFAIDRMINFINTGVIRASVISTDDVLYIMNSSLDAMYSYDYNTSRDLIINLGIGDKFNSAITQSIRDGTLLALSNDEIPKPKRIIYNINAIITLTRGNDGYYYDYSSDVNKRFIGRRAYFTRGMK